MVTTRFTPIISSVANINEAILRDPRVEVEYNQSPRFNFDQGDFDLIGGNLYMIDGKENLRQWIIKILSVPINHYLIYSPLYGNPINNYLGRVSGEVLRTLIPKLIRESLLFDNRIIDIVNIESVVRADRLFLSFIVITFDSNNIRVNNSWSLF